MVITGAAISENLDYLYITSRFPGYRMEQDKKGQEFRKFCEFADLEGKALLEVGCGNGRASAMLAPLVDSLTAIDPDEERLRMARPKVPGADFRRGSGEALEFPDESFDIVAFTFSLHHQNPIKALAEASRVLRPSGRIIIIEPAIGGDMHPLFKVFRDEDREIAATLDAIENCGLFCEREETFHIEYLFDDPDELYGYFFGEYGMTGDSAHVESMNMSLGNKIADRPIKLVETVNMFALTKI